MLIRDHIDMLRDHALRGPNDDRLGPRFPDMTHAYANDLRLLAKEAAAGANVKLEEGVYVAMPGPTYETPAEVKMLQTLGADATGMSTVPEVVVARHMGAQVIGISCITNHAAGGLNPLWAPGTLMLIRDHIDMLRDHPLRGPNDDRLGPRFPDMTAAYAPELRALVKEAAGASGIEVAEGIYAAMPGPTYETPAEVRMLQLLGADAVGMSTVPEVCVARHMGARVIGISCITNQAAGITGQPLSHDEVTATAARVRATFETLLDATLGALVADGELAP